MYYKSYHDLNNIVSDSIYFETQGISCNLFRASSVPTRLNQDSNPIASKILDAISYIQLNLKKNITVGHRAKRTNLQHDYFSRLFLQFTGERPLAYIHSKRIERAQYLIAATRLSFSEIAIETGFENVH